MEFSPWHIAIVLLVALLSSEAANFLSSAKGSAKVCAASRKA